MKKIVSGIALITLLLTTACGSTNISSQESKDYNNNKNGNIKIGYAINTLNNPFFVAVKEGAQKEAKKLGIDLVVTDANNTLATQISGVEDLIQQKVNVIILDPVDSKGDIPAVEEANKAGIKVITTGRHVDGGNIITHLGYDEVKHGEADAEFLAKKLNGKGNVVELQGIMGTNVAQDRSKGFEQGIAKYPGIKIVAKQAADFDRAKGLSVMENILQAEPKIDGIYAANDEMALGAIQAIKATNRKGIIVTSNDGTTDALQAIKAGDMAGTMAIYPNQYGEKAVEIANDVAKGQSEPNYIELPSIFVSQENVDTAIQQSKN